jgi:N-acetyl-gamma-glutamyl-phosphate reductase
MAKGQRAAIAASKRVSNPGCYPTGAIALIRPLVAAGVVPQDWPISVNAISGYSGGGNPMIAEFEDEASASYTAVPYRIYAMGLEHKHVPELQVHSGLLTRPIFAPSVGRYRQGMIVEVPLHLGVMGAGPSLKDVHTVLHDAYRGERFVEVASLEEAAGLKTLDPEGLNGSNRMKLFVFGSEGARQARLVALLDNLGKGASGAAVQSLNLMLGLPEAAGL